MKKMIIKLNCVVNDNIQESIEAQIKRDLHENGFVILDDRFDLYEIDIPEGADK